eukprot:TRINITY_DN165_c0_g1_i2.p2 TRINITY_DN165_c0_g1~~TRINITY_DN165_c0_g1_i2.p2  ORF type:complete len:316 (-),score=56.20 TRINITY_DN165_c0_g1_i2:154-1101(-)
MYEEPRSDTIPTQEQLSALNTSPTDGADTGPDEVRTLFLAGIPFDVKEREIHNLFRPFRGYEGAVLKTNGKQPVAFASFVDQPSAIAAKEALEGIHFDPNSPVKLCIELAKQNSRGKRGREQPLEFFSLEQTEKRLKRSYSGSEPGGEGAVGGYPSLSGQGQYLQGYYNDVGTLWNQSLVSQGYMGSDMSLGYGMGTAQPSRNPPCNTLFVGNLGTGTSEQELREVFGRYPGFRRLRLNSKPGPNGGAVCFVEYQDAACSTHSMNGLQGWPPRSSDRPGGMRIEYAKNRMGEMSQRNKESLFAQNHGEHHDETAP